MTQLHLFPTILKMIELEAPDSPKRAFYRLMIEECQGIWSVIKESGANGKVLDRRRWVMKSAEKAVQRYERILRDKLNPNRGSPRKYKRRPDQRPPLAAKWRNEHPSYKPIKPQKTG